MDKNIISDNDWTKWNIQDSNLKDTIEILISILFILHEAKELMDIKPLFSRLHDLEKKIELFPKDKLHHLTDFSSEDPQFSDLYASKNINTDFLIKYDLKNDFLSEDIQNLYGEVNEILTSLSLLSNKFDKNNGMEGIFWGFVFIHLLEKGFLPNRIKNVLRNENWFEETTNK